MDIFNRFGGLQMHDCDNVIRKTLLIENFKLMTNNVETDETKQLLCHELQSYNYYIEEISHLVHPGPFRNIEPVFYSIVLLRRPKKGSN
jgi:hypothetical protein